MLIRSQNKKHLLNLNSISQIYINGICVTAEFNNNKGSSYKTIGEYSTEAKAIKVLDMIQEAYEFSCYSDHAYDNAVQVQRPYIFVNNRVFQMPQDSEVEE